MLKAKSWRLKQQNQEIFLTGTLVKNQYTPKNSSVILTFDFLKRRKKTSLDMTNILASTGNQIHNLKIKINLSTKTICRR